MLLIAFFRMLFGTYMSGMHLAYCLMASQLLCLPPLFLSKRHLLKTIFIQLQTAGISVGISKHPSDHVFISGMLCQESQLSSYLKNYQFPSNSWKVQSNSLHEWNFAERLPGCGPLWMARCLCSFPCQNSCSYLI